MESFFKVWWDVGFLLVVEVLYVGYDIDEEVYVVVKVVDNGQIEYDFDDNVVVILEKKKIEFFVLLDYNDVDYDRFNKDFYEEFVLILGMLLLMLCL